MSVTASVAGCRILLLLLSFATVSASAYEVLENGRLRFGTGNEASVNANGNLQQPFYYDGNLSNWYKLTFSNYPLDNAIGIDGDGTSEWNLNGAIVENGALAAQAIDVTGFTATSGTHGYGRIVSTGTVTVNGKTVELKNTYELPADKSFVKITTRLTNTSGAGIGNVRLWVGTRDDYVGTSDQPTKQRGNLADGAFTTIGSPATRAAALKITSGATGVLFYSTSDKAHTSINECCSFSSAYQQNPQTSSIEETHDGSYALFVRMANLANGEFEEFTWYYAAGPVASLDGIVEEVTNDESGTITVSTSAGAGGAVAPSSADVAAGATTNFTITPDGGYHIDAVSGCSGSLTGNVYTTGAIGSACTVAASFAIDTHEVSASAGSGGTISPSAATVDHNSTASFVVTPATGYDIGSVHGCAGALVGNTFTTAGVTSACTVTASFVLRTYAVTSSATAGGNIGPANSSIAHGTSAALVVTPNSGFHIVDVQGCGGSLSGNTFTTAPITAACAVSASFALNIYAVTAVGGEGGSIDPASTSVTHGSTAEFTVAPNSGYDIVSVQGCSGALVGSSFASGPITAPCSVSATFSVTAPNFDPAAPTALDINSTELFSALPASAKPKAFAFDGTELEVVLAGGRTRYEPGSYVLTWRAVDARGVAATVEQVLRVWPSVSFGPDLTIGARAGNSDFFRIALNGRSPVYPLTVDYAAAGDLEGHDLQSGRALFAEGEVEKQIGFAILSTSAAGSADRQVRLSLDPLLNRASERELVVTLTSLNKAPAISLSATQGNLQSPSVARDSGPITITADIRDPNTNDSHTLEWVGPSGAAFTKTATGIVVQPDSLPIGVHRFELVVTDNGSPASVSRSVFELVVRESAATLPSGASSWLPNGLPNHSAYAPVAPNVLPERAGELTHHVMESDAGTQLRLGAYAILHGKHETELASDVAASSIGADSIANVGGYFDFVVAELPRVGDSVSIVIPQRLQIPARPVYRKYDPATSRWMTFVEDVDNRLASAPGAEGFCPPTTSVDYRAGLNSGDWCVRLTIKDGGPNDTDKQANGSVADPGGVGSMSDVVVAGQSKNSGGGGSFTTLLLLATALVALMRARVRARAVFLASLSVISFAAVAEESRHWYGGLTIGQAHTDTSESELTHELRNRGYDATATLGDTTRSAWRAHLGRQWTSVLGLEMGYTDLGDLNSSFSGTVGDPDRFVLDTNELHPISAGGFDLSVVARYPIADRVALKALGGVFVWDSDVNTGDAATHTVARKADGVDVLVGLGIEALVTETVNVSVEASRYYIDRDHADLLGVGLHYRWR